MAALVNGGEIFMGFIYGDDEGYNFLLQQLVHEMYDVNLLGKPQKDIEGFSFHTLSPLLKADSHIN
jgi:hypothetical protein